MLPARVAAVLRAKFVHAQRLADREHPTLVAVRQAERSREVEQLVHVRLVDHARLLIVAAGLRHAQKADLGAELYRDQQVDLWAEWYHAQRADQ